MSIQTVDIIDERWFKISDVDSLRPFFINLVSDSNHWMFISSNGGVTAGRKNPEYALFPYYTDDKITELNQIQGSKTIFQISKSGKEYIWEPFSERQQGQYEICRNLYKNKYGNKILFEEINADLGLTFRYQWNSSNRFGFVKHSSLENTSGESTEISVLDGIQNLLPYGVDPDLQVRSSNLVDGYKRSELIEEKGIGIYALSAIIVDKAEPSEALKANIVWSTGFDDAQYLLSSLQLDKFRNHKPVQQEKDVKGEKGAYFINSTFTLSGSEKKDWYIVADVNKNQADVVELGMLIENESEVQELMHNDIDRGTEKLIQLVAGADGLQRTADEFKDTRHYSNVLFNIMRGGTFDYNYTIEKQDFTDYLLNANKKVAERNGAFLDKLEETFSKQTLDKLVLEQNDADLLRLAREYLPLKFSRRHGDPSRPWNNFSINTHSEVDGSKILDYEGNWRDIFQNWEALAYSYPGFIEGMIFKFLNASTFDGYNPYRVTKDGFDWEIDDPEDPWAYIGYWGDHQIIYLLKFLEFYDGYKPGAIEELLTRELFVYANVPYRIKSYEEIVQDPKNTIDFDTPLDDKIRDLVDKIGADGALLSNQKSEIQHANFVEKLLVTTLAKLSNFVPEAGIWMNTQRPEWNDANNALVGNGVSMVTLYYLRRFFKFFQTVLSQVSTTEMSVSDEVADLFEHIAKTFEDHKEVLNGSIGDKKRREITDELGKAGSNYRNRVYNNGFNGAKQIITKQELESFTKTTLAYLEHSIKANKREDNLYHAYNIITFGNDDVKISHLDEMLEGQVAVLSSGFLNAEESLELLNALRDSSLYREDQQSYILYPNKQLPGFMEKNNIPKDSVMESDLLKKLADEGNRKIIIEDAAGSYHFNGNFTNARDLKAALDQLKETDYKELVERDEQRVLDIFEEVFNHKAFTGRSGTFFAYEGLGSIYWHMVSKLHLAVFEVCKEEAEQSGKSDRLSKLATHFYDIGEGIGVHKSPEEYGAFPTDPYSHTPQHRGAQQPGMTGQVKEDILVRFGEVGLSITNGELNFKPFLLKKQEFFDAETDFRAVETDHNRTVLHLNENELVFTVCQVPVIYHVADKDAIEVVYNDETTKSVNNLALDADISQLVFRRTGEIKQINVSLRESHLRED